MPVELVDVHQAMGDLVAEIHPSRVSIERLKM
jgi:hypothetical protein